MLFWCVFGVPSAYAGGFQEGLDDCNDPSSSGRSFTDPVYLSTGTFFMDVLDMSIQGRGFEIEAVRTYRSRSAFEGFHSQPFGPGWYWSFGISLDKFYPDAGGPPSYTIFDGRGRVIEMYQYQSNPATGAGRYATAHYGPAVVDYGGNDQDFVELQHPDGRVYKFYGTVQTLPLRGRIYSITDRTGANTYYFEYGGAALDLVRVYDDFGRSIQIN